MPLGELPYADGHNRRKLRAGQLQLWGCSQ